MLILHLVQDVQSMKIYLMEVLKHLGFFIVNVLTFIYLMSI